MKRYRLVCPELGLSSNSTLGGEIYDVELLTRLAKMGWEIDVLVPKDRNVVKHKNIHVTRTPIKSIAPPHVFNLFVYRYLQDLWTARPFDLVRVHNPYFVGLGALLFRRHHPTIPIVAQYHHLERASYAFLDDLFDRHFIKSWDAIVTLSEFTKREITEKYRIPKEKVYVSSVGCKKNLHRERERSSLQKLLRIEDKHVLLFFGRMIPRKNPGFFLDVLSSIQDHNVMGVMIGTGPLLPLLRLRAKFMELTDRIRFVHYIQEKDLSSMFSLADILLFPSFREGFGMVPIESMLCETVPIAHRSTGMIETIDDGKDGYLLPLSIDVWAKTIHHLLENPTKRHRMGKAGRAKVLQNFSWDSVAEKNDQLYRFLIERRRN